MPIWTIAILLALAGLAIWLQKKGGAEAPAEASPMAETLEAIAKAAEAPPVSGGRDTGFPLGPKISVDGAIVRIREGSSLGGGLEGNVEINFASYSLGIGPYTGSARQLVEAYEDALRKSAVGTNEYMVNEAALLLAKAWLLTGG